MTPSCWRFWARGRWPRAALGGGLLIAAVVNGLTIPVFIGHAIDALHDSSRTGEIPRLAAMLIGLTLLNTVIRVAGGLLVFKVAREAELELRDRTFAHLIRLDSGFFNKHAAGDLASRWTADTAAVSMMWSSFVVMAVGAGGFVLFACVAMVWFQPWLALWALVPVPFVIYGARAIGKVVRTRLGSAMQQLGALSTTAQEDLAGIGVVRTYHLERTRQEAFATRSAKLRDQRMATQRASGSFAPLLSAFTATSMFAVLWVGGNAVIDGKLGMGTLVQFSSYLAMVGVRVTWLGDAIATYQRGMAGWSRIGELLAYKPAIVDGAGPALAEPVRGELELRDLTLSIGDKRILDHVSLRIPAGTTCAIVGRVGSGKSKLLETIPRLVDVPAGMVFLDGRDVTTLPLSDLRGHVAYASQSPFLYSATITDNIALGFDAHAPDEAARVRQAAETAGLTADLGVLPSGLDTQVGERGITVSGGQRQRIALARTVATATTRQVLVLDDSLSSVDAETERQILDNLDRACEGKTRVVISHRIAAIRRAHQIAVLDEGKLVELGTHDELLARGGVYAELYRAQSEEAAA